MFGTDTMMVATERLYLTADRKRLVREGDRRAATLYCTPGTQIPASAVALFGLVDGTLPDTQKAPPAPATSVTPAATPAKRAKSKPAPANKEAATPADKSATGGA